MALTKIGTDGVKDDAVTSGKIPANAVGNSEIAQNAVSLDKLPLGNSTVDGKFLRANNGAAPTFETIAQPDLTNLSASNLTSGTVPDARLPATLPAVSGANLTNLPAANITGTLPAISGANLTNLPASGKVHNLIINGAMNVAQRGTSVASTGYKTVDRWQLGGSWQGSAITQEQANVGYNSTPYDKGFRKSFKLTNSNQGSASAADNIEITYSFEGQEIATSGWDYVNSSKKITLSFWVKSSVAQTFYGYFRTFPGVDMKYSFPIVCSTTDWEYKTVSIVGESNFAENAQNSFPNNNSKAMVLRIVPFYGTNYTDAGSVSNAWQNYSGGVITPVFDTSWYLTNGATFEITGVQLEVGDTATDFEHRSFADEMAKCQRYFYMHAYGQYVNAALADSTAMGTATRYTNTSWFGIVQFPVKMRATPSFVKSLGTDRLLLFNPDGSQGFNDLATQDMGVNACIINYYDSLNSSQAAGWVQLNNNNAYVGFSAEL